MRSPWNDPVTGHSGRAKRQPSRPCLTESLEQRRLLDGLTGQYFNRQDLTEPVTTRTDPTLDFTWAGSPATGVNADHFSVRWTGQVQAQYSEKYTFTTTADDGVRLWVDGRLLVDNWVNGQNDRSGSIALEAGKRYDIRVDYYDYDLGARMRLQWSSASTAQQTVPSSQLFASPGGLAATYFDNLDFSNPLLRRSDANVDFNWPAGTPDAATVPANGFAARWTGWITPDYTETYTFKLPTVVSGVFNATTARLTIDGKKLLDLGSVQADGRIALEAGVRYPIQIDYADLNGAAGVTLQWSSPSQPLATVPGDHLFAAAATSIPTRRVTYTNPTLDIDAPDPGILYANGAYWMTHTMGGPNTGWPLWKSLDGVNWTFQKNLLTTSNKQSWMSGSYWAPEIHKVGTSFVLTGVSTDSRNSNRLEIVMASSPTIDGTYTVRSEPLVADNVANIDSTIFQDDDGKLYLIWKRDSEASGGIHGTIRIRPLDSTGMNFAAGSSATIILDNENGGWEKYLAEAPEMIRRNDAYYLIYSGAFIDTTYSVGVARNTNLTSMFTRNPANPIISNNATWGGPGHGDYFTDADGTVWFLYHAHHQSNVNFGRVQILDPLVWTASGWPSVAGNSPSTTPQAGPKVQALTGGGVLSFNGDANGSATNDTFRLVRSGVGSANLDVYLNGTLLSSTPFAEIQSISLDGKLGDDQLQLDFSKGDVLAGSGVSFNGNTGTNDSVKITAPAGATIDRFRHFASGQFAFGSGLFSSTGVERTILDGGDQHLTADPTIAANLEVQSGTLAIDVNAKLGSLTIDAGATTALTTGNHTLLVDALTVASGGTLDLTDGALIVDYADTAASPLSSIEDLLRTGRAGGAWTGPGGILSSVAAANTALGGTLGSGPMADLFTGTFGVFTSTLVDRSSVLVRYTVDGDADLNRTVDFTDLLTLAKNYGTAGHSFTGGNFDYSPDGTVDFSDLLLLAKHYGQTLTLAAALAAPAAAATTATRNRSAAVTGIVV